MRLITLCLLFFIPLYQVIGSDTITTGRGETRNDYRDGYSDGYSAGEQEGQQLWQALGCFGASAGSFLGCLSFGITFPCFEPNTGDGCLYGWEGEGINPYLYITLSGCAGGMLTGGSIALMAGRTGDSPTMLIGHSPEYTQGYIDGYRNITKRKKGEAALTGAVIGTVATTSLMLLWVYDFDNYE